MLKKIFTIAVLLPFIEIIFFIFANNFLSFLDIVTIILISGIIGFYNLSRAKVGTLEIIALITEPEANNKKQMLKPLLYCISGLLLIIPGLISDSFGLAIMLYAILGLKRKIHNTEQSGKRGTTIEGEYNSENH